MAMKKQILEKIERNAEMLGMSVISNDGITLTIDDAGSAQNIRVSYDESHDLAVSGPMLGVSDAASPFLGVNVMAPGTIKVSIGADDNDATDEVIADLQGAITVDVLRVLRLANQFANDVKLAKENAGAGSDFEVITRGDEKLTGLGQ